jgi:hypothetical protein
MVAGAAGAVDDPLARLGVEPRGGGVLPQPMGAEAHQVVHQVVAAGHTVEDAPDQAGLVRRVDVAVAEGSAHGGWS